MHWNLFAPRYALTLLLIIGSLPFSLHAQHQKNCAHLEAEAWMQDAYPKWPTRQEFEAHLSRAQSQTVLRDDTIYTIPVIIHVVHDGEPVGFGYNISQEQILSQIEVLNEDYRRKPGTPGFNSNPVGADIQIEFCLAAVDPEGNLLEELGIHRINRNDENWIDPPFSVGFVKQAMMPLHFWDPERYMNVWSVPLANDFLGFAQLPNFSTLPDLNPNHGPAVTDGVVITPTAFGRVGSVEEPYNQGRTMTHEVGHWLGLLHIWGDGPCGTDDNCPDTPEAIDPHYDCPDERTEACGDANFYENYMDYTDDVCMNLFTSCQRSRMRTVIQVGERRVSLLNSDVCQADLPPIADFSANRRFVCEQSTVRFSSQSRSNPTAWEWEFPGGNPSSSSNENPAVSYETSGTYDVRLIVSNAFGADTLAQTAFIKVDSVGSEIILSQTFETGLGDWTVDNPDGQITWELAQVAGTDSGEIAIGINLYEYTNARARDGLISPLLDLSGYEGAVLTFQHAYRQGTLADRDSLLVQVSQNGGDSYANTVLNVAEDGSRNFATNVNLNESYVPERERDWCFGSNDWADCFRINLTPLVGEEAFKIKFETVNDFGNNLYLDNINLEASCVVIWDEPADSSDVPFTFTLYPNPGSDLFYLRIFPEEQAELSLQLFDTRGRDVYRETVGLVGEPSEHEMDFSSISRGIYFLRMKLGDAYRTTKLVIR